MSLKKQQSQLSQITRTVTYCKAIPNGTTLNELIQRLENTKQLFNEFKQNQDQVEESCGEDNIEVQFTTRGQVEDYFFYCCSRLNEAIDYIKAKKTEKEKENANRNNTSQQQEVKLPRIELTPFSGLYEDWTSFKDLYTTLIHDNKSIANVQKLHYLKTNVEGDAYGLLKSINVTEANYPGAWKKLLDRYEHKRYIVDSLLKRFFEQPSVTCENHSEIKGLIDKSAEIVQGLQVQGVPVNQWDTILVYVVVSKLDGETHKHWELRLKKDELPRFSDLQEFLEARWQSLEMISGSNVPSNQPKSSIATNKPTQSGVLKRSNSNVQSQPNGCACCSSADHTIGSCPRYVKLDIESRLQLIKTKNLCFNCLKVGHSLKNCRNKSTCQQCHKNHHTSIHNDKRVSVMTSGTTLDSVETSESNCVTIPRPRKLVLLATAVVHIFDKFGGVTAVKTLIDQGSENAIIKSNLAKRLGFERSTYFSSVKGIGDTPVESEPILFRFRVGSCVIPSFTMEVEAISMEKITGDIPLVPIEKRAWPHLEGLKLADRNFDCPSNVELLLGAEAYENIILNGLIKKVDNSPTAQNSQLGWLLFGAVKSKNDIVVTKSSNSCLSRADVYSKLDETLRLFWEIEDIPGERKLSAKENQAESIFKKTVSRTREGRYRVSLPFDPAKEHRMLGDSRSTDVSCLFQLEKRFIRNQLLKDRYREYMQNLINSGHVELVPKERMNLPSSEVFYLPHHAVLKESSTTTKLRVVFDASRKSSTGISLNDKLLVGPKIQDDLFSILIRWRKHEFSFIADAEKMFRQIELTPNQRDFQRIVWRFDSNEPVKEYRIATVIDGTASAPFLATRTLHQVADDVKKEFPTAAKVIKEDFYMDDVSSGSFSVESTIQLRRDLTQSMENCGFRLRKWLSNCQDVLESIPVEDRADSSDLVEIMEESVKTLGVFWNPKSDCFEFKIASFSPSEKLTKRQLLSEISKLFDPIGWLSPVTIVAKTFMQSLWSLKEIGWDDRIPGDKLKFWKSYQSQLKALERIKIPRWIGTKQAYEVQLHGFGDASISAYAAVVYARVVLEDGTSVSRMIGAKTRVAPVKVITVPKLELSAALLLSKLMFSVNKSFRFESLVKLFYYSDNTSVLAWIKSHPNHKNIFVANIVTEIQSITNVENWYFVDTENNPADCASRGVFPSKLEEHNLWWKGPAWLTNDRINFPKQPTEYVTDLERKQAAMRINHVRDDKLDEYLERILHKHSNLVQLQRRTSMVLRCHPKSEFKGDKQSHVTAIELRNALNGWIRFVQSTAFSSDVIRCRSNQELTHKSKLKKLRPFLDDSGILRVGGRVSKAKDLPFRVKHPIILPKRNHLTKLIIEQAHQLTLHGGPTLMSSYLCNYWFFGRSEQIRRVVRRCTTYFAFQCKPQEQIMADLPESRVTPNRTFMHSGVDFAGPIITKTFTGRSRGRHANPTTKSYICIFVCLVTKALHIELVTDMSSRAFKAAFDRFTARRGRISDMYSDCGTNFVAADKELREEFKRLMKDENLQGYLAKDGTTWHFNPPASPHFGGLWEAGVKSIKHHLKRLVGNNVFTFEEMTTLLCKIEACLNSRPLCAMSDDINDVSYLTPGHFTIGEPPIVIPEQNHLDSNVNRLSRWQLIQRTLQQFWKIWSSEYLSKLQQRPKWFKPKEDVREGQLVLLREDYIPPAKWPLARITDVHRGRDGKVRVVTLEKHSTSIKPPIPGDWNQYLKKLDTHKSVLDRPISKISVLPIEDNEAVELRANVFRDSN